MRGNPLVVCMALVFVSTTIAGVVLGAESQPLAFKNYVLGVTELDEVKKATSGIVCRKCDAADCDDICYAHTGTVAEAPINTVAFSFYDDKLEGIYITFRRRFFDDVIRSLKQEYGLPSREEKVALKSFSGEPVEGRELFWRQANGMIRMEEYSSDFKTSGIHYTSFSALDKFMKRETQNRQKGDKDSY